MLGDEAYSVLLRWQAVGIFCTLDEAGNVVVTNCTWPALGDSEPLPVPSEALDELGQWYDEILSHLRYWCETKALCQQILEKAAEGTST